MSRNDKICSSIYSTSIITINKKLNFDQTITKERTLNTFIYLLKTFLINNNSLRHYKRHNLNNIHFITKNK